MPSALGEFTTAAGVGAEVVAAATMNAGRWPRDSDQERATRGGRNSRHRRNGNKGRHRCGRGHSARHAAHCTRKHQGSDRRDAQGWVPRHPDYPLSRPRKVELTGPRNAQVGMRSARPGRLFGTWPQAVTRHAVSVAALGGDGGGVGVAVAVPARAVVVEGLKDGFLGILG